MKTTLKSALVVLMTGFTAGGATASGSLIADIPFDEGTGVLLTNQSTAESTSIEHVLSRPRYNRSQEPKWNEGGCISGSCLRFDGYSNYAEFSGIRDNQVSQGFTISLWVAPFAFEWGDAFHDSQMSGLVSQFDRNTNEGFVLGVHRHGTWGLRLGNGEKSPVLKITAQADRIERGKWNHLAVSYDPERMEVAFYKNGSLVGKANTDTRLRLASTSLSIGRHSMPYDVVGVFKVNHFNGLMDNLKIFDRVLGSSDVQSIADSAVPQLSFSDFDFGPDYLAADPHRPLLHAIPHFGWMNEPHAPFYHNGRYHLFFQKNPHGPFWHQMHWGHWVSEDLVNWREVDIALFPDDQGLGVRDIRPGSPVYRDALTPDGVWSGSATYSADGKPVLFFTTANDSRDTPQEIGLAIPEDSTDPELLGWKYFPKRVIERDLTIGTKWHFRDPFVFFDEESKSYFNLITSAVLSGGTALVYESKDLINWNYRGTVYESDRSKYPELGTVWELPVLLPVKSPSGVKKHVLLINSHGVGAKLDVYYWVGNWNPKTAKFVPDDEQPQVFDFGSGVFTGPSGFVDPKTGRSLLFSIAQGQRTPSLEADSGWAHTAGMPLELALNDDLKLTIKPVREHTRLRSKTLADLSQPSQAEIDEALQSVRGDLLEVYAKVQLATGTNDSLQLHVRRSPEGQEQTTLYLDQTKQQFGVDRSKSSLDLDQRKIPGSSGNYAVGGEHEIRVIIDRSLIQAYLDDVRTLTTRTYPGRGDSTGIQLVTSGRVSKLEVYELSPSFTPPSPAAGPWGVPVETFFASNFPNGSFESCDFTGWTATQGNAFDPAVLVNFPTVPQHGVPFHSAPAGADGCHVWGYQEVGDTATGELTSDPFELAGSGVINFLIGGGENINDLFVALEDVTTGEELFRATGMNFEEMRRVYWDASDYVGRTLRFRVVDKATGGWGHINLDDFNLTIK